MYVEELSRRRRRLCRLSLPYQAVPGGLCATTILSSIFIFLHYSQDDVSIGPAVFLKFSCRFPQCVSIISPTRRSFTSLPEYRRRYFVTAPEHFPAPMEQSYRLENGAFLVCEYLLVVFDWGSVRHGKSCHYLNVGGFS